MGILIFSYEHIQDLHPSVMGKVARVRGVSHVFPRAYCGSFVASRMSSIHPLGDHTELHLVVHQAHNLEGPDQLLQPNAGLALSMYLF
jgi:hypothetical protein